MCLNLSLHHARRLKEDVDGLIKRATEKTFKTDPLLRSFAGLSRSISIVDSLKKSHGLMIEKALVDAINCVPDSRADRRVLKNAGTTFKTDCYAWNKKSGEVFVFECKRDYDQVDSRALPQIDERLQKIVAAFPTYAKAKGISYASLDAFILSFYPCNRVGQKFTVYDNKSIARVFPPCVVTFLKHYLDYTEVATRPMIAKQFGTEAIIGDKGVNPFMELDREKEDTRIHFQNDSYEFI